MKLLKSRTCPKPTKNCIFLIICLELRLDMFETKRATTLLQIVKKYLQRNKIVFSKKKLRLQFSERPYPGFLWIDHQVTLFPKPGPTPV